MSVSSNTVTTLPFFHADTIIRKPDSSLLSGTSSFTRAIILAGTLADLPLGEALTVADRQFTKIAHLCGATVVNHVWGVSNLKNTCGTHRDIPGLSLVARVEALNTVSWQGGEEVRLDEIDRGIREYRCQDDLEWVDGHVGQFSCVQRPTGEHTVYLTDIDIIFYSRKRM